MAGIVESVDIDIAEAVKLGAIDSSFFAKQWFPQTYRQGSPDWDDDLWEVMDSPLYRRASFSVFRGGAKTTRARIFTAKRIAYGLSRTVLYVGASEGHAARSIQWLRRAVERNKLYRDTFALRPGRKWQETEAEIHCGVEDRTAWVLGVGITGNIRGINFDDYRPDLIILDDPLTDENAATEEQRKKIIDLILGALDKSLAPASEEPNAKIIFLQTPMHVEDALAHTLESDMWKSLEISCWTPETRDLPVDRQLSNWEERFTTTDLRAEKREAIAKNRYYIFAREMEVQLVTEERSAFKSHWLQTTEDIPIGFTVVSVDPAPPPTDRQLEKGLADKDYEVIAVLTRGPKGTYVREYSMEKGTDPGMTINTILSFAKHYRAGAIVIETVAYQQTLKWLLEQEMKRRGIYFAVYPFTDKMKKYHRIKTALNGPGSAGRLFCHPSHDQLIQDFQTYPVVAHDDLLDCIAIGVMELNNQYPDVAEGMDFMTLDESQYGEVSYGGAP